MKRLFHPSFTSHYIFIIFAYNQDTKVHTTDITKLEIMRKIIFILFTILFSTSLFAQINIYEYKDDKAYCTFEIDGKLIPDSTETRGTYRAYKYYDIPYFEITFKAKNTINEIGDTILHITPDFYYHSYRAQIIGQNENLDTNEYKFTFIQKGSTVENITPEEDKVKVYKKSALNVKRSVKFYLFPEVFTKTATVDWKVFPKDLRNNLKDKDKKMGRKY